MVLQRSVALLEAVVSSTSPSEPASKAGPTASMPHGDGRTGNASPDIQRWRTAGYWFACALLAAVCTVFAYSQAPRPIQGFGTVVQESALGKVIDWVRYPRESNPWERLTQFTTTLQSVTFAADGERGWAVGAGGAIVATANGGATWERPPYSRSPAPWLYILWGLIGIAGWLVYLSQRPSPPPVRESIHLDIRSDQPADSLGQDRLGFAKLVLGLTNFLRNENTRPPFVLAVNGDWGMGKSSVMRMLAAEMRRLGVYPVEFNAWHHQEDRMIAVPFLESVVQRAVPPLISAQSPRFRARLAFRRIVRNPYPFLLFIGVFAASAAFLSVNGAHEGIWPALTAVLSNDSNKIIELIGKTPIWKSGGLVIYLTLAFAIGFVFAVDAFRAFPVAPGVLGALAADRFKLRTADLQSGYRRRFARWFEDVAWALKPRVMLILVDDLDRCPPPQSA